MAHIRQQAPTDPDSSGAVLALMIRPWAPAAVSEHVRLVLGDSECAARSAVWVEISYGLEGAPLTYLRHILQVDSWRCAEQIEQLLNGKTPYATWRSDCPPALLMARAGDADAQGNPTYQVTLQLTVSGLTDGGPRDGSAITFALDRISGEELLRFGEAFDQELRQALNHRWPDTAPTSAATASSGLEVNAFSSRVNAAAYNALGTDYSHDYLAEPFFREAFEGWLEAFTRRWPRLGDRLRARRTDRGRAGSRRTARNRHRPVRADDRPGPTRRAGAGLSPVGVGGTGGNGRLRRGLQLLCAAVHGPDRVADWPGAVA